MSLPGADGALLAAALASPLLLLLLVFLVAREREPRPERGLVLLGGFAGGALAAVLALLLIWTLASLDLGPSALDFLLGPLLEESLKLATLLGVLLLLPRQDARDTLATGLAVGLGFGALENGLYALYGLLAGGLAHSAATVALRVVGALLLHAALTGILGDTLGRSAGRAGPVALALVVVVALHGAFNALVTSSAWGADLVAHVAAALGFFLCVRRLRAPSRLDTLP